MFHRSIVVFHLVIQLQCTLSQYCGRGTWTKDQPEEKQELVWHTTPWQTIWDGFHSH